MFKVETLNIASEWHEALDAAGLLDIEAVTSAILTGSKLPINAVEAGVASPVSCSIQMPQKQHTKRFS